MEYIFEKESYLIRGCMMNVQHELGCGFAEKVYQEALELEFNEKNIPFQRESRLNIWYKGMKLKQEYVADFICYDKIIVEIKAVTELNDIHRAQVFNYLKASNFDRALLVNFGEIPLKIERIFNYHKNRQNSPTIP